MKNIGEWQPTRWAYFTGYGIRDVWVFAVLSLLPLVGFALRLDPHDATVLADLTH